MRFLGRVPYEEILGYYRGALALVFPSLIETFGHPLLEAMLAGTPILAADIASFREVAGDAALYFPPQDPVQLAAPGGRAETRRAADPGARRARPRARPRVLMDPFRRPAVRRVRRDDGQPAPASRGIASAA